VQTSAKYLADHMGEVPTLVIACIEGRVEGQSNMAMAGLYGSMPPAAWSFMLAARPRTLGSAYTTLHPWYEREVAERPGIQLEGCRKGAQLAFAYDTGEDFAPAARTLLESILHWEQW
jgi:hypothetical protein